MRNLTQMSRFFPGPGPANPANRPRLQKARSMARRLLGLWVVSFLLVACLALMCASCIYPAPLELDTPDAGPSAVPVIVSASPAEFAFPGVVALDRHDQRTMFLSVSDADLEDNLYVRLYVDYGRPYQAGFLGECNAVPSGEPIRVADCSVSSLCNSIEETDTGLHVLEAMVADRAFLTESNPLAQDQPPFRRLPSNAASSLRAWLMECNPD